MFEATHMKHCIDLRAFVRVDMLVSFLLGVLKVFVDSAAIMYLLGTEMDYKKEELSSSFVFNNPNETERCGCGESFKIS